MSNEVNGAVVGLLVMLAAFASVAETRWVDYHRPVLVGVICFAAAAIARFA